MANHSQSCSIASRPYEGLPQNTDDDRERARELYKYFSPPKGPEPIDTVLTAHAQLAAWRLHAERAMVSLIDEETQYFVAESTKTVQLDDAEKYEDPEDAIWAGCVRVPKAGRLCEHTIAAPPPPGGGVACFEVLDLSKDVRFNTLNFIAGPPHFRYYAGVPLRTSKGINIGSIYILDSKLRPALTLGEKGFLGVMADNVIQHLEMSRDKKDRQRTFKMNECLSAYVDPSSEHAMHRRRHSDHDESTDPDSDGDSKRTADGSARIDVIVRAAELLREAMDIEEGGGGVLFLDTALAISPSQEIDEPIGPAVSQDLHSQERPPSSQGGNRSATTSSPNARTLSPEVWRNRNSITETLAHTYQSIDTSLDQPKFEPFSPEDLLKLIKRYPRGRMFTFDQQGQELSDSSGSESLRNGRPRSKRRRERSTADSTKLHAHFPTARQIMFTPIWDSTTSRSAACFIYNCSEYRNFTHQLEFLNFITFNNCVDTELLRLANLKATDQKNDFIGSISHELRSPLHGILASCEFLQDTSCTSFQQSLVSTAESCARTLLDTVNMVLDYSKINAFEKSKASNGMSAPANDVQAKPEALQTNLSAHRDIDLAILTEEVVEGVAAGHAFNDPQNRALHDDAGNTVLHSRTSTGSELPSACRPDVELIIEIQKQDWTYWCEAGSLRRIVMNLVGNSLKYTKAGFVHVKLETQKAEHDGAETAILTIKDSGQGMSPAYLRDKLFTPFAQESNQAPGIGLGLSLVKSIVTSLAGRIDIESTVGIGTKVVVKIPLIRRPTSKPKLNGIPESHLSPVTNGDQSSTQRDGSHHSGKDVAIYWPEDQNTTSIRQEASQMLRGTIAEYLKAWNGAPVNRWQKGSSPDIIVVEEPRLNALFHDAPQLFTPNCPTVVLVLRGAGPARELRYGHFKHIEDVRYPIGPQKLARALQACLDRARINIVDPSDNGIASTEKEEAVDNITAATRALSVSNNSDELAQVPFVAQNSLIPPGDLIDPVTASATMSATIPVFVTTKPADTSPTKIPTTPPRTPEPLSAAPKATPTTALTSSPPASRVLLVDDNAINLRLLQVGMERRGYTSISSASDGLQAVNTYRTLLHSTPSTPPELILMDLSMPVMDGFEATRQIRKIEAEYNSHLSPSQAPHHALIVALTGLASVTDQKKAYIAGVDSYIMKPVSFAKLTRMLEDWTVSRNSEPAVGVLASVAAAA